MARGSRLRRRDHTTASRANRDRFVRLGGRRTKVALVGLAVTSIALAAVTTVNTATTTAAGPVGNGFVVTAGDLSFILKQIKIAERHSATATPDNPCATLVGPASDQIPDRLTSYGLRTVDGSCNNLFPGRETFAAADMPFLHLATPMFRAAEPITAALPVGRPGPTSYNQFTPGNTVIDSAAEDDQQPHRRSDVHQPSGDRRGGVPGAHPGQPGPVPVTTNPDATADPPVAGVPWIAFRRTRRCSSPT